MGKPWEETRREFRRIAARVGVDCIAREIPMHRSAVYRLIGEETQKPHAITRDRIEAIVRESREQST